MPMLNGWITEFHGHYAAASAFAGRWAAHPIVRAVAGAMAAAFLGALIAGNQMLVRLDTRMSSLEQRITNEVSAIQSAIQSERSSEREIRTHVQQTRDEQIRRIRQRIDELRVRVLQLEQRKNGP